MELAIETTVSNKGLWTGRILSGLGAALLVLDGTMKLFKPAPVLESCVTLGIPESSVVGIGLLLLACTVVYVIPRTAVLGAILLTGYLGGAVAIHIRAGQGVFPVLFPVFFGALLWGGLFLREPRLRALLPARS